MSTPVSTSIPRARGTSLHRQLFLVLRQRILSGEYPAGAVIPKEEDLCTAFAVSRITVRRAVSDLEAQGFVQRRQGLGTFVREDFPVPRAAATLSYVDALHKTAMETRVEVVSVDIEAIPAGIAGQLSLEPYTDALHAVRLRKIGQTVVMVSDAWLPVGFAKVITTASLKKHALYELLMSHGVKFDRVIQEITAVPADPEQASRLGVEVGMPLLKTTRVVYDNRHVPVQHLTILVSPERSRIVSDLSTDSMNTLRTGQFVHEVAGAASRKTPSASERRQRRG
jgi:GntR family transcriptional regulator